MKRTTSNIFKIEFKNALIQEEDGVFTIIETLKDGDEQNDLTAILSELAGMDGLQIAITRKEVDEE